MNEPSGKPPNNAWRPFLLVSLSAVAWSGAQISKLGPVGQSIREWALNRLDRL